MTIYAVFYFSTRDDNSPDLIGMLNEVECYSKPVDEDHAERNRALMEFDDYALYFICLSKDQIEQKQYLKCETEALSQPLCGKEATLTSVYSLTKEGKTIQQSHYAEDVPPIESAVYFMFRQGGFDSKGNVEAKKDQYHFDKDDLIYADKFTFNEDFICESQANVLNSANCYALLSYNSVDIRVAVHLIGSEGTNFKEYDAKKNIQHWLRLLNDIVQPVEIES